MASEASDSNSDPDSPGGSNSEAEVTVAPLNVRMTCKMTSSGAKCASWEVEHIINGVHGGPAFGYEDKNLRERVAAKNAACSQDNNHDECRAKYQRVQATKAKITKLICHPDVLKALKDGCGPEWTMVMRNIMREKEVEPCDALSAQPTATDAAETD